MYCGASWIIIHFWCAGNIEFFKQAEQQLHQNSARLWWGRELSFPTPDKMQCRHLTIIIDWQSRSRRNKISWRWWWWWWCDVDIFYRISCNITNKVQNKMLYCRHSFYFLFLRTQFEIQFVQQKKGNDEDHDYMMVKVNLCKMSTVVQFKSVCCFVGETKISRLTLTYLSELKLDCDYYYCYYISRVEKVILCCCWWWWWWWSRRGAREHIMAISACFIIMFTQVFSFIHNASS